MSEELVLRCEARVDIAYKPRRIGYGIDALVRLNLVEEVSWMEELLMLYASRDYRVLERIRSSIEESVVKAVARERGL